jgi:hypothetical protein
MHSQWGSSETEERAVDDHRVVQTQIQNQPWKYYESCAPKCNSRELIRLIHCARNIGLVKPTACASLGLSLSEWLAMGVRRRRASRRRS